MKRTRVVVRADHDVIQAGLLALLEPVPGVQARAGAMADVALDGADVVLFDVYALTEGGLDDLSQLVKEHDCAVLAVTRDLRPELADTALEHGVDGCVSLEAPLTDLVAAIEAAAWGDLHGTGAEDSPDFTVNPAYARANPDLPKLSARERDVLARIASGMSNQEIAEELYLSINSVKTYIRTAYRRIEVSSRSQAVIWCLQHGLGSPASLDPTAAASDESGAAPELR